jgi:O-methyltransferase
MGWRLRTGYKFYKNTRRISSGTHYKEHLAMALKIIEAHLNGVPGDIVECGCWKGSSSSNLSIIAKQLGRKLIIYDSFAGLPEMETADREADKYIQGEYKGLEKEVKNNISKYGVIDVCEFRKGWFKDTLPNHTGKIALVFIDVDLEPSLNDCVKHLWPHLSPGAYLFTDECMFLNYVALFFSESWWKKHFNTTPPGLYGTGLGIPLLNLYVGPHELRSDYYNHRSKGVAYTFKGSEAIWNKAYE